MFGKWLICAALFVVRPVYSLTNEVQNDQLTDREISCDAGWYLFGEKCYKIFGTEMKEPRRLNWWRASEHCASHKGHLATVPSKEVQEFLYAFLITQANTRAWIGLNDVQVGAKYEWDDGTEFNYTNWNIHEHSAWRDKTEDCVEILFLPFTPYKGEPGEWNDANCKLELPYICQIDKGKQGRVTSNPILCPQGMGGGWKYKNSCYNIVNEPKTWEEAEKYCQDQYKGHLVMILDFRIDYFLQYIMMDFNSDIWIGVKMKDQFEQQFSSGWYVAYTNWNKNTRNLADDTCVIRKPDKTWETVPCTAKYPFICEVSTDNPPALKKPLQGSKCPDLLADWRDLGGEFCYFIDTTNTSTWYQANFGCIRRGGSLASFHSKAEADALAPFLITTEHGLLQRKFFIGIYRPLADEEEFIWADGTPMDFTYWDEDEPESIDKKCGELWVMSMKWKDVDCNETKGYICSVRKSSPNDLITEARCECLGKSTFNTLIGVIICCLLLVIFLSVVIYYFGPWRVNRRKMVKDQRRSSGIALPVQEPVPTNRMQYSRCNNQYDFN